MVHEILATFLADFLLLKRIRSLVLLLNVEDRVISERHTFIEKSVLMFPVFMQVHFRSEAATCHHLQKLVALIHQRSRI